MMAQYETLLDSIAASPDNHVASLPIASREPERTEVTRTTSLKAAKERALICRK
jgi:hypothetical protein